ncbi:F-box protein CPR30-like [Chenopodium quinoa]|uniref:F-box protein CPR30-like n=1 Tax=Chenopodium quinoa TaxID=63459 RepID=UPI000B779F29|nr:F-box protein CPR30-like [Chenopodium quinoa]
MNKNSPKKQEFAHILKSFSLPNEIIQEIFYILPAKSVFRFKAVNKEWNSILSSEQFMQTHCSHQRRLHRVADDHLIFLESDQLYLGSYNNLFNLKAAASAELENPQTPHKCRRGKSCSAKPEILGSGNGLVSLSLRDCYNEFILWNPVTKKHISIYPEDYNYCDGRLLSGLCYNASCNEYSVVLTIYDYANYASFDGKAKVFVVNFRTGRSKQVEEGLSYKVLHHVKPEVGTVVCGVPHWLSTNEFESLRGLREGILYFDLADGVFRQMARPDHAGVKEKEIVGFGALNGQHQLGIVLRDSWFDDKAVIMVMARYGKRRWNIYLVEEDSMPLQLLMNLVLYHHQSRKFKLSISIVLYRQFHHHSQSY